MPGVSEERAYSRYVVNIGEVEHIGDEIHVEAFAKEDFLGDAEIVEDGPWADTGVAAQVAVERAQCALGVG